MIGNWPYAIPSTTALLERGTLTANPSFVPMAPAGGINRIAWLAAVYRSAGLFETACRYSLLSHAVHEYDAF